MYCCYVTLTILTCAALFFLIRWVEQWIITHCSSEQRIITRCSSEQRIFRIPCSLELQNPPFRRVMWAVDQFSSTFRAILWAVDPSSNHFSLSCGWHKSLINPTSYMLIEDARLHTANQEKFNNVYRAGQKRGFKKWSTAQRSTEVIHCSLELLTR